jgi:alanine or glycine:cation symporter, AGCS family
VVVCTMTALVIVITDGYTSGAADGISLTSASFATVIWWFPYVLSVAVVLFAFSTMLSWSYYGLKAWTYLFGTSQAMDLTFKVLFCAVVVIGASMELGAVVAFSDAMVFAMCFPNILGLYIMAAEVKVDLNAYKRRIKNVKVKEFA